MEIAANDTPSDFGLATVIKGVESEYTDAVHVVVNDASGVPLWVRRIAHRDAAQQVVLGRTRQVLGVQLPPPHDETSTG